MANEGKDRGGRDATSADGQTRDRKQARTSAEDAAEELPELSEHGGIEPTENRQPSTTIARATALSTRADAF